MGEEKRGRGRPKKEDEKVRKNRITVRMTDNDLKRLDEVAKWAKMDRVETIRTLIFEAKNFYVK